jgi:hypothetical protein
MVKAAFYQGGSEMHSVCYRGRVWFSCLQELLAHIVISAARSYAMSKKEFLCINPEPKEGEARKQDYANRSAGSVEGFLRIGRAEREGRHCHQRPFLHTNTW